MADNLAWTAGAGTTLAADDIGSVFYPRSKVSIGTDGTAADWSTAAPGPTVGYLVECSTQVTRPANTTTYTINDALADTTPTSGGFTFTSAGRISGGAGIITDLVVAFDDDAATPLQGEVFLFDQSVTAITDNAVFAITDAEARTCIGKIPFALEDIGNQGFAHVAGLNIGYVCSGTANLRFLVRVKNGYVPTANSGVITFVIKCLQIT